ncbi:caspase-9 [Tiliqua scincoides]|uniref:caspase-9 n=1 Tax=Tiliqua scincoides TaxID=71010 RepID=UPI003462C744
MEEEQRRVLQRNRLRLVQEMRVEPLWDLLVQQGIFSQDMTEEIQRAGTRRDQARQLVTDLQTRGKRAFPAFIWCLQETGQNDLAALLHGGCDQPQLHPADIRPVEVHVHPGQRNPGVGTSEYLPPPAQVVNERFSGPAHDVVATRGKKSAHLPPDAAGNSKMIKTCMLGGDGLIPLCMSQNWSLNSIELNTVPELAPPFCFSHCFLGSGEEASQRDPEMVYTMKTDPCGCCLIINNVMFSKNSGLSTRTGSDIDCKRLERRFRSLHFEVLTRRDLKAEEIIRELQSLARRDHTSLDCCLVVILSHGCQNSHIQFPGGIYGTDGRPIPVERIVSYFNGYHCPSLRGKPKLFFIQACGGEQKDRGFEVDSDSSTGKPSGSTLEPDATPFQTAGGTSDETDAVASLPTPSDILVSYSTFPGFVSWRDKESGSWYVETLDQVLEKHAHSEDLQNMLLRVSYTVSTKGKYKQMPGCFNFLRKRFFFVAK